MNYIIKHAVVNGVATAVYVVIIALFLFNAPYIFGEDGPAKTVLVPIVILLLLVLSVAITGSLVFGRPVLWYLDGKKKEALYLLGFTLLCLFNITVFTLAILYIAGR